MKNIKDFIGTKTAINCRTQQEWDRITELLGYKWLESHTWIEYGVETCITCDVQSYSPARFYEKMGYNTLPASDFLEPNTTMNTCDYIFEEAAKLHKSMTPTELPEGPRILLDEKTGERFEWKTGRIKGDPMGGTYPTGDIILPHIERKPLFVDLCGNPVFEGDMTCHIDIESGKYINSIANKHTYNITNEGTPIFLNTSDCEKAGLG